MTFFGLHINFLETWRSVIEFRSVIKQTNKIQVYITFATKGSK